MNTEYMAITVTIDLNEGRTAKVSHLGCRESDQAFYGLTNRMYVAALYCEGCGDEIIKFDAFTKEVSD